ncbi:MAG: type I restriction-modification system subunit M N-terminal domain-containing protein, partial [Vulcanococcus sp.]
MTTTSTSFQQLANFIWSVADLLRGPYRPPQYERVMLPLTVLRRFDAVLAPSKEAVLKRHEDALRDGDEILAVVRGVGLSNDGRGRGLLAVHAGAQTTGETVRLAAHAKAIGADAVAVIGPPYFALDAEE